MPLNWTGSELTYTDYTHYIANSITLYPDVIQTRPFSDCLDYKVNRTLEDRIDELVTKRVEEILNAKGFILGQIPAQADEESYDRIMENNT